MTTPEVEEGGVLREWAPMSRFLHQIPQKLWSGLFPEDVNFTCVAADEESIAVGTSPGVVFFYERQTHTVHELRPEKSNHGVTCVCVASSVEYMVASGDASGVVTIFRIPKDVSACLPTIKSERIERYTIGNLHTSPISALAWSTNAQKLFSGDIKGIIVLTEVDYTMSITRAYQILNEKYKIVQLCYNQKEQILIVSTELRSILCHRENMIWRVVQIGQRERHNLLELGANFCVDEKNGISVFSCRGGARLWKSDLNGNVSHTIIFKDLINAQVNPVKLLRPMKKQKITKVKTYELGTLHYWTDGLFVTHYKNDILVLDPENVSVSATLLDAQDDLAVAVTKLEIFLIFGKRNLIRLAYAPDKYNSSIGGYGNLAVAEPVPVLPAFNMKPVVGTLFKVQEKHSRIKLSATTANMELPGSDVMYGMESVLFPTIPIQEGVPEHRTDASNSHLFSSIGQQDFDEIVYIKHKRKKKIKKDLNENGKSLSFSSLRSSLDLSEKSQEWDLEKLRYSLLPDIKLDEALDHMIKNEADLDEIISLARCVEPPCPEPSSEKEVAQTQNEETIECDQMNSTESTFFEEEVRSQSPISAVTYESQESCVEIKLSTSNPEELVDIPLNDCSIPIPETKEETMPLPETLSHDIPLNDCSIPIPETKEETMPILETLSHDMTLNVLSMNWSEMSSPEIAVWISAYKKGLVLCSPSLKSFSFDGDLWYKLPYKAQYLVASNKCDLVVKVHCSVAHYSEGLLEDWKLLSSGVEWATISDEGTIWFVSQGLVYYLKRGSDTIGKIESDGKVQKIYLRNEELIAITEENQIAFLDGAKWLILNTPENGVRHLSIGPNRLFWAIDTNKKLFVTQVLGSIQKTRLNWWKVDVDNREPFYATLIVSNEDKIFTFDGENNLVIYNNTSVVGRRWEKSELNVKCLQMTAEAIFEDKGCIWLLSTQNQLLSVTPSLNDYNWIETPCKIICIAASPQVLWVLSDEGAIFMRQHITHSNPSGYQWGRLNLEQFDHATQIVHISCGCDVVWACDIRGVVFMLVASPHRIDSYDFTPAWVKVEGRALHNNTIAKVFVGPQSHMVWALDNAGNVYVREGIFNDFLVGTDWVLVPGISACHLTISTETVRALCKEGIYTRTGISQSNYIGDSWIFNSADLQHLSATVNESIYGISSGSNTLMRFVERIFPISEDVLVEKDWNLL